MMRLQFAAIIVALLTAAGTTAQAYTTKTKVGSNVEIAKRSSQTSRAVQNGPTRKKTNMAQGVIAEGDGGVGAPAARGPGTNMTLSGRLMDAVRFKGEPGFGEWTCLGIDERTGFRRCQQFCLATNVSYEMATGNKCVEKGDRDDCPKDGKLHVADYCCSCEVGGCVVGKTLSGLQASTCNQNNGSCVFCGYRNNPKFPGVGEFSVVLEKRPPKERKTTRANSAGSPLGTSATICASMTLVVFLVWG